MSADARPLIQVAYGDSRPAGLPVVQGVPLPAGAWRPGTPLAARAPGGELRPAHGRALVNWPDGSARWCLVSFGAHEAGDYELVWGTAAANPVAAPTLSLRRQGDRMTLVSDELALTINETGPGIFSEIRAHGHAYLAQPGDLALTADAASTVHETRRVIEIHEETPQRVRLRVSGGHCRADGTRFLSYRLDIEVWAGWPTLRLDYQFFNLEPGADSLPVQSLALRTRWQVGEQTERHFLQRNHGLFYISRHVWNPAPVTVLADFVRGDAHVSDPAMLLDPVDYPFYLHAPLVGTEDWLGLAGSEWAVYARMPDFLVTKPNQLHSAGNELEVAFWPSNAGPMDLPQGRSKRQTVLLSFVQRAAATPAKPNEKLSNAPRQAPKGVVAVLNAPWHEGRATVAPAWLAARGEFEQGQALPSGEHVRIEGNLRHFVRLDLPVTKFDVGDTDSHYASSYASINEDLVPPLAGAPKMPRIWPTNAPTQTYLDCHEPVWTNNEYDAIHAFCGELMRTGRHELWTTLRLCVRHNIEVDFLHYSDHRWLHRATPAHSARHTTTGAYPSHFWTQGLLEYYCLTGDRDALEVAVALGDKIIETFTDPELRPVHWGFNREIGWSVLALACLVEVTGEARFRQITAELVDFLMSYDRAGSKGAINLSAGNDRQNFNRQMVANFFGYASLVDGVEIYARQAGRPEVTTWLRGLCADLFKEALNAAREGQMPGVNFAVVLNTGYELTGEQRYLDFISLILDQLYWSNRGMDSGGSIKPLGSGYRGLTRLLGHAWRHGLLAPYEYPAVAKLRASTPG